MERVRIKSSSLLQTVDFVRETFGEAAASGLLASLPARVQRQISLSVLDAWIDFELFVRALQWVVDEHYGGDVAQIRASGRFAAQSEYPRRFGALSLPPDVPMAEALNGFAPLWRMIVDQGRFEAVDGADGLELHICDFPAASELYGHRLAGWLEAYVEQLIGEPREVELHACDPTAASSLVYRVRI